MAKTDMPENFEPKENCTHDNATTVINKVNEIYGGVPKNLNERILRSGYIANHTLELYDVNHDGFISLAEYIEMQWSVFVPVLTHGGCRLTREGYIRTFVLDRDETPPNVIEFHDQEVAEFGAVYDRLAKRFGASERGYMVKSDMAKYFKFEFDRLDKDAEGRVTIAAIGGRKQQK